MSAKTSDTSPDPSRTELAEARTDWAEDRTVLANERTFAGWLRTGLAAIGIGVGFHILWRSLEPAWVPKAVTTLFIVTGILIFWTAQRRACTVIERLTTHEVKRVSRLNIRMIAALLIAGALVLIAAIWLLDLDAAAASGGR